MKNLKDLLWFNKWFFLAFAFIALYTFLFTKVFTYESSYQKNDTIINGKVTYLSINGNKLTLNVKGKENIIANYYIKEEDEIKKILEDVSLGDAITLQGNLVEPSNNTIPNTFNYKNYLYNKKIYYTFNAESFKIKNNHNPFYKLKDFILKRAYKMPNKEFFLTFIMGDKSLLDSDTYNGFQTNGVSHLLAVSGMHISVLLYVILALTKNREEKTRFIISIIFLGFFLFLTNFAASLLRAVIFFALNKANKFFDWHLSNLHLLFITAFIILIYNPFMIYDLGFIYSFVVCFGIMYYQDRITGNYISSLLKLSLITFLFSMPISLLVNYEINLTSIVNNLLFVPLVSFLIYPLSLITFILPFLNPILSFFLKIMSLLGDFCKSMSLTLNVSKMPFILIMLFYVFLLLGKFKKKFFVVLIVIILTAKVLPKFNSNSYVYYLDIGQGDCSVLISAYQKEVIVIDTGGKIEYQKEEWEKTSKSYNLSDNTITFLKSKGITKIDYLILSHGDADHAKEAINLIKNIKVRNVLFNNDSFNNLENKIINILKEKRISYFKGIAEIDFDNSKLYFLETKEYDNENDNSIVTYLNLKQYKFLFMGDAGVNKEKDLINKYNLKDIDFLKVGHHGSDTSSSQIFIDKIRPKYSLISVGKNNRYNHPKESVLDILKNSKVYRTDQDGSVEIILNKNGFKINTYNP